MKLLCMGVSTQTINLKNKDKNNNTELITHKCT